MLNHFIRNYEQEPDRLFITDCVRGQPRKFNNRDLMRLVCRLTERLADGGVGAGDRVLLTARSSVEWVALDLAAQFLGALPAALNPQAATAHKERFVELLEPKLIVGEEGCQLLEAGRYPAARTVSALMESLPSAVDEAAFERFGYRYDPDAPLFLGSTSGTTGGYKACIVRYRNALASCEAYMSAIPLDRSDRNLAFLQLAHTRVNDLHFMIVCQGELVFGNPFQDWFPQFRRFKPTIVAAPPLLFERAMDLHASDSSGANLESYFGGARKLYTGTTPVAKELIAYYAQFGLDLYEIYGMTECCSLATGNHPGFAKPGTVGKPQPGMNVTIEADGEIVLEGPSVFAGYWNDPAATAETLREGRLHTGDVGEFDEGGFLLLKGRKKDTICLSTGRKVFPKEYEARVGMLNFVGRFVLVGNTLERPVGVVYLPKDTPAARASLASALAEINRTLPYEQQVVDFVYLARDLSVESGEITSTGKPIRTAIEARYWPDIQKAVNREVINA